MPEDALVVIVTIESGEPLTGSMTVDPNQPGLAFSGWIGFIETIHVLRRRSGVQNMGRPPDVNTGDAP